MKPVLIKTACLFRREFWEHRGSVLWTPVAIACGAMALIVFSVSLGLGDFAGHLSESIERPPEQAGDKAEEATRRINFATGETTVIEEDLGWALWGSQPLNIFAPMLHSIAMAFQALAFVIAFFYLLGTLFNDRKDRTILFWKSLPVNEAHSLLVKLLFAMVIIPLVALLASVAVQIVGGASLGYLIVQGGQYGLAEVLGSIPLLSVLFAHCVLILVLMVKNLPVFSWLLFSSALSRRSPFLTALLPPLVIVSLEGLIFGSSHIADFFSSLFVQREYTFSSEQSAQRYLASILVITPIQLLKIVVVSTPLLCGAIWLRNNRYEV